MIEKSSCITELKVKKIVVTYIGNSKKQAVNFAFD
jgi:hypothetical protein